MYSTKWEIAIPTSRLPEARAAFRERLVPALNGTPGLVRLLVPTSGGHSFGKLGESGRHIDADGYSMDCYALWETETVMRANLGRLFIEGARVLGDAPFFPLEGRRFRGAFYEVLVHTDDGTNEGLHAKRADIPVLLERQEDAIGLLANTVLPTLADRPGFAGALVLGSLKGRTVGSVSEGKREEVVVRPYECLTLWRTREDMEAGGDHLRSLVLHATPPIVPKGRLGTIYTTRYDEVILLAAPGNVS